MPVLAFFIVAIAGESIEFTSDNVDNYIGSSQPVLVKFYSPYCGHCQSIHPGFVEASRRFPSAVFGNIDCINHKDLCERFRVETYPNIRLFLPGSSEIIDYDGDYSTQSLIDFLDLQTDTPAKRVSAKLIRLDSNRYDKLIASSQCSAIFFYGDKSYRHQLCQFEEAAAAFDTEENVSFGTMPCDAYRDACHNIGFENAPVLKIVKKGVWTEHTGPRFVETIVDFVNEACGTNRAPDGMLNDVAGIVPEADRLITEFLNTDDQKAVIEKVKTIPGAEFYAQAMERFITKGKEATAKDVESMRVMLAEQKASPSTLDRLKARYNVLKQFVPPAEPPDREL
jgi:protein disulfide-isomerase A6